MTALFSKLPLYSQNDHPNFTTVSGPSILSQAMCHHELPKNVSRRLGTDFNLVEKGSSAERQSQKGSNHTLPPREGKQSHTPSKGREAITHSLQGKGSNHTKHPSEGKQYHTPSKGREAITHSLQGKGNNHTLTQRKGMQSHAHSK